MSSPRRMAGWFGMSSSSMIWAMAGVTRWKKPRSKTEYPKTLYHPKGEEVVTVRASPMATPFGPQMVGEQRELVSIVVKSKEEEDLKLAEGWHKLPIMAIRERFKLAGQEPPAILSN